MSDPFIFDRAPCRASGLDARQHAILLDSVTEGTQSDDKGQKLEARQLQFIATFCDRCPADVKAACLDEAVLHKDSWTPHAGLTSKGLRRHFRQLNNPHGPHRDPRGGLHQGRPTPNPQGEDADMDVDKVKQDKALTRVQKLLAQANHPNTTQEESETFFQAAFRLMEENAIDDALLRDSTQGKDDPLVHARIKLASSTWRSDVTLGVYVAKLTDCFLLQSPYQAGYGAHVHFYGRKTNVDRAQELFHGLLAQANVVTSRHREEAKRLCHDPRKYLASVREGFIVEISRRLLENHQARSAPVEPGAGLVPISLVDEAKAFAGDFRNGKAGNRTVDSRGWAAGRSEGRNASLGGAQLNGRRAIGQ